MKLLIFTLLLITLTNARQIFKGKLSTKSNDTISGQIHIMPGDLLIPVSSSGLFKIPLNPGEYTLTAWSLNHRFGLLRVKVDDGFDVFNVVPGLQFDELVPLNFNEFSWVAVNEVDYSVVSLSLLIFKKKEGFNILSILMNPMTLMMAFSLGIMFIMPKLMENLDDATKENNK